MSRLRLPAKLGLLAGVLLVPLMLMTAHVISSARQELAVLAGDQQGARLVRDALELSAAIDDHRTLTHRAQSGEPALGPALQTARVRLGASLNALDAAISAAPAFQLTEPWQAVRARIDMLVRDKVPGGRAAALSFHGEQVEQVRRLTLLAAERSGLLLDSSPAVHFLVDLSVNTMIPWVDRLGQATAAGGGLLMRGDATRSEKTEMRALAAAGQRQLDTVASKAAALIRAGVALPSSWDSARVSAEQFINQTERIFGAEALVGEPEPNLRAGNQASSSAIRFGQDSLDLLDERLNHRLTALRTDVAIQAAVLLLCIAAIAYLLLAFHRSFSESLRRVTACMDAMAAGDLSQPIRIEGSDELARVGAQLEAMSATLSRLVAEIRSSAVRVGEAGQAVAVQGQSLSQRTERQAGSLRESVDTVGQLGAAVASTAQATASLDDITTSLRQHAELGTQAMRETVESIGALQDTTRRVSEINGVIDEIAFQTNLLALNAAVEAAHAGESGKGFAVVSAEVRQLAQRCGEAAGEIRDLIGRTIEQTDVSAMRVHDVSIALDSVVSGISDVADRLRGIAGSSAQQSAGLTEVSRGVQGLDEITRQNAEMVDASARSSQALVFQAAALGASVASIRLRHGSADEALALVRRAIARVGEAGWQNAARELTDPDGGFRDRDMAVYAIDLEGRVLAYSARPEWVGRMVHDLPGISSTMADRFLAAALAASEQGEGWAEYDWADFDTGAPARKTAFVARVGDEALVGCGVFRVAAGIAH
ncbi:MAG TPA: methyl-accepting chemotaxis protein [Burkholderiaceae bacterium]|nr:methyl-accepting chemotaxis protein [Burkholderiaceae bacterium]